MAMTFIHASVSLDDFMADTSGSIDWMSGFTTVDEDFAVIRNVTERIGAIVGGANRDQTVSDGEQPYGGMLRVPVYLMTHSEHAPIEKDGTTYTFVVDDISAAVDSARESAGDRWVSLLGGSISRQCLQLGLVDEIHLDIVPILLGEGISLFAKLGQRVDLERIETSGFAGEVHLRYRVRH